MLKLKKIGYKLGTRRHGIPFHAHATADVSEHRLCTDQGTRRKAADRLGAIFFLLLFLLFLLFLLMLLMLLYSGVVVAHFVLFVCWCSRPTADYTFLCILMRRRCGCNASYAFGVVSPCFPKALKGTVDSLMAAGKLVVVDHELIKVCR